jgi:hypothetical protein
VIVLPGLERDVVAEPLRLLVRVGVTADVDQQRGVVDDRPLVLVEPDPVGKAQGDHALPQHVLHRLPETEIDAEGQRRHQLCEPRPLSRRRVSLCHPGQPRRRAARTTVAHLGADAEPRLLGSVVLCR